VGGPEALRASLAGGVPFSGLQELNYSIFNYSIFNYKVFYFLSWFINFTYFISRGDDHLSPNSHLYFLDLPVYDPIGYPNRPPRRFSASGQARLWRILTNGKVRFPFQLSNCIFLCVNIFFDLVLTGMKNW